MKKLAILFIPLFLLAGALSAQTDNNRAFYYENGNKKSEGHVVNGKQEGPWVFYYENGRKKSEGLFKGGDKFGEWKYYYSSEQLKSEGKFVVVGGKSVKNGPWTTYHKNGAVESEGAYRNGKPVGVWKKYNSSEQLLSKKEY